MSPVHRIRSKSASTGGSGPPSSDTYNQYVSFFERVGPASYDSTNGIVLDFSVTYSSINACQIAIRKGLRSTLPACRFTYTLNSPAAGKVSIFIMRFRNTPVSTFGSTQNQPAGVTVQAASGTVTSAEATHIHTLTHDHASQPAAAGVNSGAGVNSSLATLNQNVSTHGHAVDVPNLVGNTGAGSSHTHADNNIYAHSHTTTLTATNATAPTLANATNLSAASFLGFVTGVRK